MEPDLDQLGVGREDENKQKIMANVIIATVTCKGGHRLQWLVAQLLKSSSTYSNPGSGSPL